MGHLFQYLTLTADVLQQTDQFSLIGFLNTFGGGALANFSILAMGIMPYITASIIVQLLQMDVVPKFTEWAKQGEVGRRKLAQFTRYFTIVLAFIQAIAMSFGFNRMYGGSLIKDRRYCDLCYYCNCVDGRNCISYYGSVNRLQQKVLEMVFPSLSSLVSLLRFQMQLTNCMQHKFKMLVKQLFIKL